MVYNLYLCIFVCCLHFLLSASISNPRARCSALLESKFLTELLSTIRSIRNIIRSETIYISYTCEMSVKHVTNISITQNFFPYLNPSLSIYRFSSYLHLHPHFTHSTHLTHFSHFTVYNCYLFLCPLEPANAADSARLPS